MKLNRNAAGWADVADKLRARVMSEQWPATDLQCAVCDLATLFTELDSLRAQLAETEAERDRQYEENVSQIMRYAALEAQFAEREGIARELALALRAVELARHTDEEIHWVDATKKTEAALASFHAAEGEG